MISQGYPKRVWVGLIEETAFVGDFKKSPMNFQNYDVGQMTLRLGDREWMMKQDAGEGQDSEFLYRLYETLGYLDCDAGCYIRRSQPNTLSPFYLWVFDCTPENTSFCDGYYSSTPTSAVLSVSTTFSKALPNSVIMLIIVETPRLISIQPGKAPTVTSAPTDVSQL